MVKGVRKAGAKIKRNLFGPLSLVEITANRKENAGLSIVRDVSCHRQINGIASDINKTAVAMFINELVYRSIQGEMHDQQLFDFLYDSIIRLDETIDPVTGFHLIFALQLAHHLGFGPHDNYTMATNIFDLEEAYFRQGLPDHPHYLDERFSLLFHEMIRLSQGDSLPTGFHQAVRQMFTEKTIEYFRLHVPSFGEMKSHYVLSEILRD
jgi:DNA repair protein RecO (recombination protein O)